MVVKCPICGEENPDDSAECRACGAPLGNLPDKKARTRVLIAVFVLAILIVASIVAAPIIYKSVPKNHHTEDTDGDGMPDSWETDNDLNPDDPSDRNTDADGDGLSNFEEYQLGTDPQNPDTDGDGVEDGLDLIPKADAGIWVRIDSIRLKDFVDFPRKPTGQIFARVYVDDVLAGEMPSEPAELEIDKVYNVNWSVYYNVSDDRSHKVRIELYDKDMLGEEMLDINGNSQSKPPGDPSGYYLEINYYLGTGDVGRFQTGTSDGSDDGNTGLSDDKDAMITYTITTVDMSSV